MTNAKRSDASSPQSYNFIAKALHWLMATLIITMLFVGATMVTSLTLRPSLLEIHRPLGIAILILAVIRLFNRLYARSPDLPKSIPNWQKAVAKLSHLLLYMLMLTLPLIGWAVSSAAGFPVTLWQGVELPRIVSSNPTYYAILRDAHSALAWALFAVVVGHLSAALMHAWINRDGVFTTMYRRQ